MCPQLCCSPQSWWKTGKNRKKTQVHPEFFSNSSSLTCSFGICQGILYQNNRKLIEQVPQWRKRTKLVQIHQPFLIFFWLMDSNVTEIFHEDPGGRNPSSSWILFDHLVVFFILETGTPDLKFPEKNAQPFPFSSKLFFLFTGGPGKFLKNFWATLNS